MEQKRPSWDEYFMGLAYMASMRSKDQGAKLGAVIVGKNNNVISTGYNDLASGLEHTPERMEKPAKLFATACAESNAIFFAARIGSPVEGSTIYTQWCPCNRCTVAIIQTGIKRVVTHKDNTHSPSWDEEMVRSKQMLAECGVEYYEWSGNILQPKAFKGDQWVDLETHTGSISDS